MTEKFRTQRDTRAAYVTRDGSQIRELMHPSASPCRAQSLAEARVAPGHGTLSHLHPSAEELYHVLSGRGRMSLGNERFDVGPGDTVCILPGTPHAIENTGSVDLVFLCCCAPPYAHEDTELVAENG